jgi:hypothetical protein
VFGTLLALLFVTELASGAYTCWRTAAINTAFSEGRYVAIAIVGTLQLLIFAGPLVFLHAGTMPAVTRFIIAGIIFLNNTLVSACIFIPKLLFIHFGVDESGVGGSVIVEAVTKTGAATRSVVTASASLTGKKGASPTGSKVAPTDGGGTAVSALSAKPTSSSAPAPTPTGPAT